MQNSTIITKAIFCSGLAILSGSCQCGTPQAPDAASVSEVEGGVRQMAASISRDIAADGPSAWLRYFTGDNEFFMANNGQLQLSNFEEAKVFLKKYSAGVAHLELTWSGIRVDTVAPGRAVMAATYREVLTDTGGHVSHYDGYFTGMAVRTEAGWKLRDAHWSSPVTSQ